MVTIKDVAKRSGFSIATVSAVINGAPVVSPKAKERILQAIKELGYRPNAIARSLKSSKTLTLGIIVRDITNPIYPEVIYGLEDVAWSNNYEVFLCNTENNPERELRYIENLIEKRVDGIIITTASLERNHYLQKLQDQGIPYVFLNRMPHQLLPHERAVTGNNRLASIKVVDHLVRVGYSQITFFGGPQDYSTFRDRHEGFVEAVSKYPNKLNVNSLFIQDYSRLRGYEQTIQLIESGSLPEVIFCSSDLLAFGVYDACKESGVRIPEDLALISIDNNKYGDLIDLSSVDMQYTEMGRVAGKILIESLNQEQDSEEQPNQIENQHLLMEPRLVIRKSCGA